MKKKDLVVDMKGHCFMCLTPVNLSNREEFCNVNYPAQFLLRHLDLTVGNLLGDGGMMTAPDPDTVPFSQDLFLSDVVERSKIIKVPLCEDCHSLNDMFSNLYRKMEKIKLRMESCLEGIHGKFTEAEEDSSGRVEEFIKLTSNQLDSDVASQNFKIGKTIRTETMRRCAAKVKTVKPRIVIPNLILPKGNTGGNNNDNANNDIIADSKTQRFADPSFDIGPVQLIKIEIVNEDLMRPKADQMESEAWAPTRKSRRTRSRKVLPITNSGAKKAKSSIPLSGFDSVPEVEIHHAMVKVEQADLERKLTGLSSDKTKPDKQASSKSSKRVIRKSEPGWGVLLPQTGKWKCTKCPSEYQRLNTLNSHYQAVHIKSHYRCDLCPKVFVYKHGRQRHIQIAHQRLRHECNICHKEFNDKFAIKKHQEFIHFGKRVECTFCQKKFASPMSARFHMQILCPLKK